MLISQSRPTPCSRVRDRAMSGACRSVCASLPRKYPTFGSTRLPFGLQDIVAPLPRESEATMGPSPTSPSSCQLIFWSSRYITLKTSLKSTCSPTAETCSAILHSVAPSRDSHISGSQNASWRVAKAQAEGIDIVLVACPRVDRKVLS